MSDWTISDQEEGEPGPVAGERLADARRAADIPVRDIAKELHLDEPKVRALEENRFADLGAAVFAKGHLRKYAELVGVEADEIMADYYKMTRSAGPPPVVGRKRRQPREFSPGRWAAGFVLVVVGVAIAGVVIWFVSREQNAGNAQPAGQLVAPSSGLAGDKATDSISIRLQNPATDGSSAEQSQVAAQEPGVATQEPASANFAEPRETVTDTVETPQPGVPVIRLALSFSGDCWTEVTDADGARLFFDLGRAGSNVTVSGAAPLRVLLGNSNNVELQVDGVDYSISGAQRRGNTARMTINSL